MGGLSDFHEGLADDWTHVRLPMVGLIGTPAMDPGVLLWLDDGKRVLVGDVNWHFGTGSHCRFPCLPLVRAWRKIVNVASLLDVPAEVWATGFELDDVVFEYTEPSEWPFVASIAQKMNRVGDLEWDGVLDPGLAVRMDDGRTLLVGHVNALAGVCDSEIDGRSHHEGDDHRIERYMRVTPKSLFSTRSYGR